MGISAILIINNLVSVSVKMYSFTQQSLNSGQQILNQRTNQSRKTNGQFLTPPTLARLMANQLGEIKSGASILDPAMGSGALLCAVIERLIEAGEPLDITIHGFELDEELYTVAQSVLMPAINHASKHGINIQLHLHHADFILNGIQFLRPMLMGEPVGERYYTHIIANPPYFKIGRDDNWRKATELLLGGHTNMYTLFMGLSARMIKGGNACFIVPRSFCSGAYFEQFRREFLNCVTIQHIHLFEARDEVFSQDDVLQENLVITFTSRENRLDDETIGLSSGNSLEIPIDKKTIRHITKKQFLSPSGLFRLPMTEIDDMILDVVDSWTETLHTQGLEISTGRVVAFRATDYLINRQENASQVPLLWMQHIRPQAVIFPLNGRFHKPQYIESEPSLVVENKNYVLLRRFSTKEEARRIVAAPYLAEKYPYSQVGLENHLNYIYGQNRDLTTEETIGLSALLNCSVIDRYFRISNGNTQVNATELRALPIPSLVVIADIGRAVIQEKSGMDIDAIVLDVLLTAMLIPSDFPILSKTKVI